MSQTERVVVVEGEIVETCNLGLNELCHRCAVHAEMVLRFIEEGIVHPTGRTPSEWRFSGTDLVRMQTALRLQRDLDLNLAGAALALDLIDEIHNLRQRLRQFE